MYLGFVAVAWVATPLIYYFNVWDSKRMPIVSNKLFDKEGNFYDIGKIWTKDNRINETAYEIYGNYRIVFLEALSYRFIIGPAYMSAAYAIGLAFTFASVTALLVHTIIYYGKIKLIFSEYTL